MRYTKVAIRQSSTPKVWLVLAVGLLLLLLGLYFVYALNVFGATPRETGGYVLSDQDHTDAVIHRGGFSLGFIIIFPLVAGILLMARAIMELIGRHREGAERVKHQKTLKLMSERKG